MRAILEIAKTEIAGIGLEPTVNEELMAVSARNGRGGVLFNGHLDTVPSGQGWTRKTGDLDGSILYGRGTADMKAGCAAMLAAAKDLKSRDVPFSLLFTTDEETTMRAAKKLQGSGIVTKAAAVVVGEPTDLAIVGSEKGIVWFEVTTRGRSAHGSMPHLGDNANLCAMDLDVRYPPHLSKEDAVRLVESTTRIVGAPEIDIKHEVPAVEVNENSDHIRRMKEIAGPEVRTVAYGTEMAFYAQSNPRCLVFGPGAPEQCHVPDEHVDLAQVARAAEIYAKYAEALAPR